TSDPSRRTPLITDLGVFELCPSGATLVARHPGAELEAIRERTGFAFEPARPLAVTAEPTREPLKAIHSLDPQGIRDQLAGCERRIMQAVVLRAFGSPDNLRTESVANPSAGPGEVLLRVRACGVCFHDVINRRGNLPRTRVPAILGHEAAGEVVSV